MRSPRRSQPRQGMKGIQERLRRLLDLGRPSVIPYSPQLGSVHPPRIPSSPAGASGSAAPSREKRSEKDSPSWEGCDLDTRCALLDYERCWCFAQILADYDPETYL